MEVAKKHKERLEDIKARVKISQQYFKNNSDRYHDFLHFVFKDSIDNQAKQNLSAVNTPAMQFNILEAYISRLRGEFSKQEPGVSVRAADGIHAQDLTPEFLEFLDVLEAHLREIFFEATNDALEYNLYSDLLAGGFSVCEVFTDYINDKSFDQCIKVERVFDPTLTGFDPLARESHKGDGDYCFKIVPKGREEFEEEFGKHVTQKMSFSRSVEGFNWSYITQEQEVVLVVEYYEKQKKRAKLVKLSNGHSVLEKQYKRFIEMWSDIGLFEQPPIVLEERWTDVCSIHKYTICESMVLAHVETSYDMLPLVFFDGNSVMMRDSPEGATFQMTRPFVYHARDVQKLKNFAGQTMAADMQSMVASKFMAAVEAIPEKNMDAWLNPQVQSTLLYNAFYKDNPEVPLPPPREIMRSQLPPLVEQTFMGTDQVTQTILGSYDALLGANSNQVSGVAIQQGAMQSNAAAIPYLMGFIKGLNRISQMIVNLIPKYYTTPRTIPVMGRNGKRSYQLINKRDPRTGQQMQGSIDFRYDPNNLQVKVEAGINAEVQKQVALDQIIRLTQASQIFAEFMNTKGLETIVDNLDIRGVDRLKQQAAEFMVEMQQAKEAAAQQTDPMLEVAQAQIQAEHEVGMARVEQDRVKAEGDHAVQIAKVAVERQKLELQYLEIMSKVRAEEDRSRIQRNKERNTEAQEAIRLALDIAKTHADISRPH